MRNGFTLVEVMAVIILLALITAVSVTTITNRVNNSKTKITNTQKTIILTATELYVDEHRLEYPRIEGNTYCILLQSLIDEEFLSSPIIDINGKEISYDKRIKAMYLNGNFSYDYDTENCVEIK